MRFALLLFAAFATQSDLPPIDAAKFTERSKAATEQALARLDHMENQVPKTDRNRRGRLADIAALRAKLKTGKAVVLPQLHPSYMQLGDAGGLIHARGPAEAKILQVRGPDEFLMQIVTENENLTGQADRHTVLMRGWSTKGMIDGRWFLLGDAVRVVDTVTLPKAIGGTTTIFVLAPFDPEPFMPEKAELWTSINGDPIDRSLRLSAPSAE